MPADSLEKVVNTKVEEILNQKASLPRPPPKIILKDAWQVQHEDYHQRGNSTGKPVADEGKVKPETDFRIQGIYLTCCNVECFELYEISHRRDRLLDL